MKRYELMSKEEIIGELSKLDSSPACNALLNWMIKEIKIKKVHRYELIKSPEDVSEAYSGFNVFCYGGKRCEGCKFSCFNNRTMCFVQYLNEEIEVEDES